MSWEIVTKVEAASYMRVPTTGLQDIWHDSALSLIEDFTGWHSLTVAADYTEYVDGLGSAILVPKIPINTVTQVTISGTLLPSNYYYVAWNGIEIRTYRPNESIDYTVLLERTNRVMDSFPTGIRNIYIDYNAGGTANLPTRYLNNLKTAMLMIMQVLSTVPRDEGSDSILRKYRPDRTLLPEEVLTNYGVHGKIKGILNSILPKQKVYL